ncbi:MAG: hypothetical protein ACTSU7_12635 [Candidatus Heimdallarchaeaceae archaeon]
MAFDTFLNGFESVLYYLAIGLLISGGILILLSVILNLEGLADALGIGDHDISVDHDISMDHDISVDHDISMDHDISVDHDISMDHDISGDDLDLSGHDGDITEVHADGFKDITHSTAPIFLLMSTYFLMFGILGVSTLQISSESIGIRIFRIIVIIVSPFLLSLAITNIWKRISATTVKPIIRGVQLVGRIATVYVPTDSRGGIIDVDLGEGMGLQKLNAKSFDHFKRFEREEQVRIVAVKNRVYLVDVI